MTVILPPPLDNTLTFLEICLFTILKRKVSLQFLINLTLKPCLQSLFNAKPFEPRLLYRSYKG